MGSSPSGLQEFEMGDVIYREGDLGQELYIVRSGKVEIIRTMGDGDVLLDTIGENGFFGEMSLFGEPKRTTNARAVDDCQLLVINKRMLEAQFRQVPDWLVTMIKTIASRILTTGKGVKVQFDVSLEYSILNIINMLLADIGQPQDKGSGLPLDMVREEVVNILGVDEDNIDYWLKKLDFVNIVKIKGKQNMLLIPDEERFEKYVSYLYAKKMGGVMPPELDRQSISAFDRVVKLLRHK